MSKRRKYLPEEKIKIVKSFAVQIRIQLIVECDFPINVLGYLYRKQVSEYKFGNKYYHFTGSENMVEPIKVGRFIAQNRKNLNLTQKELAEKLGVTDRAVSKWENGRSIPDVGIIESLCKELNISIGEFFAGEKIQEKEYKKETEKMLLASLDEKQLYGVQIVIYILEFVSLELLMLPFQLSEKWPSINRINIIYWILAAVVFFCMCYLDKKMPERKLRNSNKWIQGIEAAVGFLWVVFPIASKERMNIFQGMSIGESIAIGLEIIIGFIIVVGVAIIQSKTRKEEWEEEKNGKRSD